jgi:hypothetical protein
MKTLEHQIKEILLKESVGIIGTDKFSGVSPAFSSSSDSRKRSSINQGARRGQVNQRKELPFGSFESGKNPVPVDGNVPNAGELSARGVSQESGKKSYKTIRSAIKEIVEDEEDKKKNKNLSDLSKPTIDQDRDKAKSLAGQDDNQPTKDKSRLTPSGKTENSPSTDDYMDALNNIGQLILLRAPGGRAVKGVIDAIKSFNKASKVEPTKPGTSGPKTTGTSETSGSTTSVKPDISQGPLVPVQKSGKLIMKSQEVAPTGGPKSQLPATTTPFKGEINKGDLKVIDTKKPSGEELTGEKKQISGPAASSSSKPRQEPPLYPQETPLPKKGYPGGPSGGEGVRSSGKPGVETKVKDSTPSIFQPRVEHPSPAIGGQGTGIAPGGVGVKGTDLVPKKNGPADLVPQGGGKSELVQPNPELKVEPKPKIAEPKVETKPKIAEPEPKVDSKVDLKGNSKLDPRVIPKGEPSFDPRTRPPVQPKETPPPRTPNEPLIGPRAKAAALGYAAAFGFGRGGSPGEVQPKGFLHPYAGTTMVTGPQQLGGVTFQPIPQTASQIFSKKVSKEKDSNSQILGGKIERPQKQLPITLPFQQKPQRDVGDTEPYGDLPSQKEEVEVSEEKNLDKDRRDVEYVERRDMTKKRMSKKSLLGRQKAYKTNIIDEQRISIIKEAVFDAQKKKKDKLLKPGAEKTPVDIHPHLKSPTYNNNQTGN